MGPRASGSFDQVVQRLLAAAVVLALAGCGASPSTPSPTPSPTPAIPMLPGFSEGAFREAGRITAVAARDVHQAVRPGVFERDIKQIVDAAFARERSGPPAFDHIVAAGPNALSLHYPGDSGELREGELLLIDIGATVDGHCADLSRTFPISRQYQFTPRQLELYELVVDAGRAAIGGARLNVESLAQMDWRVRAFIRSSPLRAKDANGVGQTMDKFFIHSLGHYVGRKVHGEDTGGTWLEPLVPGRVFTVEPGLYIASEGIGIRVEDTYLSTTTGFECLTCAVWK